MLSVLGGRCNILNVLILATCTCMMPMLAGGLSAPIPLHSATLRLAEYDTLINRSHHSRDATAFIRDRCTSSFPEGYEEESLRRELRESVLCVAAKSEKTMLGICAGSPDEALQTLKGWVAGCNLPKGLLHGMDVQGVPIDKSEFGAVYIKYMSRGVKTFSEMRQLGIGFDALWKPGDAYLEHYDGNYRGVYFSPDLGDGDFRQYGLLPLDLFN